MTGGGGCPPPLTPESSQRFRRRDVVGDANVCGRRRAAGGATGATCGRTGHRQQQRAGSAVRRQSSNARSRALSLVAWQFATHPPLGYLAQSSIGSSLCSSAQFTLAWLFEDLPAGTGSLTLARHKSIGITILMLALVRLGWRGPTLRLLCRTRLPYERSLAEFTHAPVRAACRSLTGWLMSRARLPGELVWAVSAAGSGGQGQRRCTTCR
jgi:hypothetical protein